MATPTITKKTSKANPKATTPKTDAKSKAANDKPETPMKARAANDKTGFDLVRSVSDYRSNAEMTKVAATA
jgi:hypothetical protein